MNILTLAAYKRARRALRGECEPNSRPILVRTNINKKASENKARCARWVRALTDSTKRKKTQTTRKGLSAFLVEAAGLEPTVSSTRNWRDTTFATPRNDWFSFDCSWLCFKSYTSKLSILLYQNANRLSRVLFVKYVNYNLQKLGFFYFFRERG